ncbi:predicted protein [Chaetomium globosum CBS 148.51]|uniref:Uncharacterized protein n=1 Tax=Chaetomium globosum (strain ATCC 6205 / CBS 148.51 / DSM 1962 / NBRC 6347 / NRRL 1970) TaxID=306901 RepID=Q2GZZ7_CHAGB|nr:uncharacterized protein CHGG_04899 [Chaetomium globosum CBS 148.51]EAQ88280.1 predicted protein [Chaetomium globosum CBS 148.51]
MPFSTRVPNTARSRAVPPAWSLPASVPGSRRPVYPIEEPSRGARAGDQEADEISAVDAEHETRDMTDQRHLLSHPSLEKAQSRPQAKGSVRAMAYNVSICTTDYLQCLTLRARNAESHPGYLDHDWSRAGTRRHVEPNISLS